MIKIDPRPLIFKNGLHEVAVVGLVMMTQCLTVAGASQTLPMMNALGDSFDYTTQNDKVWFLASFPLTAGTFILISGKIGDLYGLKRTYLYGTIWAIIWSLVTGLSLYSKNVIFFCISRGLHGIGASFMLPNGIGILGNAYPPGQRKAIAFCLVAASAPFGAFMAVLFGGLVVHFKETAWAFYANSICLALVLIAAWFFLPVIPIHKHSEEEGGNQMDWIGSILGVVGLVLFNFSWNQAPEAGWKSPYILTLLIVSIIILTVFFQYEKRIKSPLLPPDVMNWSVGIVLGIVGLGWASFSVWGFYYWSLILNLRHYNTILAGASYTPLLIFGLMAPTVVSLLIGRVKSAYLLLGSAFGFFVGITMLAATPAHQTYYRMLVPQMIILSFGMDMSFPSASLILSDHLPKKHQGMASSLVSTTTNYAMSIGLGIAATAETQILKKTDDLLKGYRAGMYVGVGFSVVSILLGSGLLAFELWKDYKNNSKLQKKDEEVMDDST